MARKKVEERKAGAPEWMATYGDMVTLLLCFFVLLFSFSTIDSQKFKAIIQSMNGSLGMLDSGTTVTMDPLINNFPNDTATTTPSKEKEQLKKFQQEFAEYLKDNGLDSSISMTINERGLVISFSDNVLFDSGKADLKPKAMEIVAKVSAIIKDNTQNIRVEGHTDNVPIHNAKYPSNWELSTARAVNVVKYMIEGNQIDPKRLSAAGYADQHPIDANSSEKGRQRNRRVDIVILRTSMDNSGPQ